MTKIDRCADDHARPFDPQWITENPKLEEHLQRFCAALSARETRQRERRPDAQGRFEAAVKSITLDLFRAYLSDPILQVGIGTGTAALQKSSKSRYGASFISARTFIDAMNALQRGGFVEQSTPSWDDPEKKRSRVARYMATPLLLNGLEDIGASVVDLQRRRSSEGIRLKDCKKRLVDYGDNAFANEARERLLAINEMLESHWADLARSDEQLAADLRGEARARQEEAAQSFDFAARTVHRVFNNEDWRQGGRFYGAWWISCPSKLRPYILIDGKRTVEVDYSGLHAAMLYAQSGLAIPSDPYERCLTQTGGLVERKLVKQTFNALLNADSVSRVGEIDGYSSELTGRGWDDFKQFIVDEYPEFEGYFGSGVGLKLQRKDSDLAEVIMLRFGAAGYACLPVHDSFIVHHGLQDYLQDMMQEVFEAEFGASCNIKGVAGIGEVVEGSDRPLELAPNWLEGTAGYEGRLQAFRIKQNSTN